MWSAGQNSYFDNNDLLAAEPHVAGCAKCACWNVFLAGKYIVSLETDRTPANLRVWGILKLCSFAETTPEPIGRVDNKVVRMRVFSVLAMHVEVYLQWLPRAQSLTRKTTQTRQQPGYIAIILTIILKVKSGPVVQSYQNSLAEI